MTTGGSILVGCLAVVFAFSLRSYLRREQPEPEPERTLNDWHEIAWAKLPYGMRRLAVSKLHDRLPLAFFDDVYRLAHEHGLGEWQPPGWHFGQGMAVRNVLREAIQDDELPPFPEYYGDDVRNWDDYYVQCVEAAAGCRPIR